MSMNFRMIWVSFADKDDVLTLLIHLGYLAYDQRTQRAYIPNEESVRNFVPQPNEINGMN